MGMATTLIVLLVAAGLEAGGDAAVRAGLHGGSPFRALWFLGGAGLLCAYGFTVNAPPWNFGRLLGVYVVFFFLLAQAIAWLAFREVPTARLWLGGALIVAGGLIVAGR